VIVTTSVHPSPRARAMAAKLAEELSARLCPRRQWTVRKLLAMSEDGTALVVTEEEIRYYAGPDAPPLVYHPSMAFVRVKRLRQGERDPLIEWSGCAEGDRIIDCTAGLASDSLVFSYAAGPSGSVTALESEPVLYALVREGLASYESGLPDVDEALRRIRLRCEDHLTYLSGLPDKSADIVYFDPMFRKPIHESSSIGAIRTVANRNALREEAVRQAVRVARKTVLMKEQFGSEEFERLGFQELPSKKTTKIAYGVIRIE